jgi:hypothetical protein
MGLKEEAIESQLARGIRTLARAVFGGAKEPALPSSKAGIRYESER